LPGQGGSDWVVLHGGATAVYRVQSRLEAARLAEAIARVSGLAGAGVLMTIADDQLTARLTRDLWYLEQRHGQLADAVSQVVREHGAVADRTRVQEVQLAIAAQPAAIVGRGRIVDGSGAPAAWILADRAGNRVCIPPGPTARLAPTTTPPVRQPSSVIVTAATNRNESS
jgi:4a-hydroxytetrahydrobiopterin dehydratase